MSVPTQTKEKADRLLFAPRLTGGEKRDLQKSIDEARLSLNTTLEGFDENMYRLIVELKDKVKHNGKAHKAGSSLADIRSDVRALIQLAEMGERDPEGLRNFLAARSENPQ